jgi:hypothetical protein
MIRSITTVLLRATASSHRGVLQAKPNTPPRERTLFFMSRFGRDGSPDGRFNLFRVTYHPKKQNGRKSLAGIPGRRILFILAD